VNVTIYPGRPSGVNFEAASVVKNIAGATVQYCDTEDPFISEGSIAVGASQTLTGTYFFVTPATALLSYTDLGPDVDSQIGTLGQRIGDEEEAREDADVALDVRADSLESSSAISVKNPAYAATGLGIANDAAALQAALDAAGAEISPGHPGATVVLPPGVYRHTTALTVPPGVSIIGYGRGSILKPEGCHGLVFANSDYIGPQRFTNFYIKGDGSYSYDAVRALGGADAQRVQGITFANVFISHVKTCFYLRSTNSWHLDHVEGYECWQGIKITGQTILFTCTGGTQFQRIASTGSGDSTGIFIDSIADYNPSGTTEKGPEGIRISDTTCFGFEVGLDLVRCLDAQFARLTLGGVSGVGFRWHYARGGMSLRDSWIGLNNGALYGMHAVGGVDDYLSRNVIEHVTVRPEGGQTTDANSIGAYIDYDHNVDIRCCQFEGLRLHDIKLNWANKVVLEDNVCGSTTGIVSSIELISTSAIAAGPYYLARNTVAVGVRENASNVGYCSIDGASLGTRASTAALTLPADDIVTITGTTNITSITAGTRGRRVTLIFAGILTFTDGSNLKLNGNFVTSADDTITLVSDGTNWVEAGRSPN
jgi:hypothetical protein